MIYVVLIGIALCAAVARTVDRPGYWLRLSAAALLMLGVAHIVACGGLVDPGQPESAIFDAASGIWQDSAKVDDVQAAFGPDADTPAQVGVVGQSAPAAPPDDTPPGAAPPHPTPCRARCGGGGQ